MTLHPATLLLGWLAFALALQWLPPPVLLGMALVIFPAALFFARSRCLLLLRRARWLLLSIAVLFSLATPGTALPDPLGSLGLTYEGCMAAGAHVLRLSLLLALLAQLLEYLTIPQLIGGLYLLLAPLGEGLGRSRIALRLLLVLEYVEQSDRPKHWSDWLKPQLAGSDFPPLELAVPPLATVDFIAMSLIALGVMLSIT
jgi:energy-coupling factor transport system permease protein